MTLKAVFSKADFQLSVTSLGQLSDSQLSVSFKFAPLRTAWRLLLTDLVVSATFKSVILWDQRRDIVLATVTTVSSVSNSDNMFGH